MYLHETQYEDYADIFKSLIEQVVKPEPGGKILDSKTLLGAFQTPEGTYYFRINFSHHLWLALSRLVSNSIVVFLRLLTSAEIRVNPDGYTGFLFHPETMEPMDAIAFCSAFVEAMGKEAGACMRCSVHLEHH